MESNAEFMEYAQEQEAREEMQLQILEQWAKSALLDMKLDELNCRWCQLANDDYDTALQNMFETNQQANRHQDTK